MVYKRKHNESEVRRRQRIDNLILELADMVECKKPQKSAVLKAAVDKLKLMTKTIAELEARLDTRDPAEMPKQAVSLTDRADSAEAECNSRPPSAATFSPARVDSLPPSPTSTWYLAPSDWPQDYIGDSEETTLMRSAASPFVATPYITSRTSLPSMLHTTPRLPALDQYCSSESLHSPSAIEPTPAPLFARLSPTTSLNNPPGINRQYENSFLQHMLTLLENAAVAMTLIDLSGRILGCNKKFTAFVGYEREQLVGSGHPFFCMIHPDAIASSFSMLSELIAQSSKVQRAMHTYVCQAGEVRRALVTCWMMCDVSGKPSYIVRIIEPVGDNEIRLEQSCEAPSGSHGHRTASSSNQHQL